MLILTTLIPLIFIPQFTSNKISRKNYEAQLYEDLLFDYNRISRPVKNSTDVLHIDVGASLIRQKLKNKILIKKYILESSMLLDEKNQVLTTNLWLEMRWSDARLQWDPNKYGGIRQLHIPSTDIWIPDFVLYDNAAGDPDITEEDDDIEYNEMGMDLSFFYKSAEWDLMNLTSARHAVLYTSFFFLVLIDLMPPTSLEVPMFGQYLITTMASVNIRFRNGSTHQMSPWIRIVFLGVLPK
uniref:Neurotransmitter-gated ion-channel ligand-binding domain-containing protein n=1 Tax=Meloidogyne floridensis TaxID=298350 RepID=A0A915P5U5_9BILA